MSRYTEDLPTGGRLHVSKAEWYVEHVEYVAYCADGTPDYRYNPVVAKLDAIDLSRIVSTLESDWCEAERVHGLLGTMSGTVRRMLPGCSTAEFSANGFRLIVRGVGDIRSRQQADEAASVLRDVADRACHMQVRLYELFPSNVPDPQRAALAAAELDELIAAWPRPGVPWRVPVKVGGPERALVAKELAVLALRYPLREVSIEAHEQGDTIVVQARAFGEKGAGAFVQGLLRLWHHSSSLRAEAYRYQNWDWDRFSAPGTTVHPHSDQRDVQPSA